MIYPDTFTFDGKNSEEFGAVITDFPGFDSPARDITSVVIPGRSGELTIDNRRFTNQSLKLECYIGSNFRSNAAALRAFLFSAAGYRRYEDTSDTTHYRMARVYESTEAEITGTHFGNGKVSISFDFKPQRWLKSGETGEEFTTTGTLSNPTLYASKPLLAVTGNGQITVGTGIITIAGNTGTLLVDCESMNATIDGANANNKITVSKWPELTSGSNSIELDSGMTVTVTPRWWEV